MPATFITDKGLDVLMFAFNVFSDVCECVTKEVTHSTLVVTLTIVPWRRLMKIIIMKIIKTIIIIIIIIIVIIITATTTTTTTIIIIIIIIMNL